MRAILMYHSIDPSGSPISVSRVAFEQHVKWMEESKIRVTSVDGLLEVPDTEDAVAITFDDAFRNFATAAWPVLEEHGLPATVFVVSDHAGQTNAWGGSIARKIPEMPLLDWNELGGLADRGVTLGAHSRTHRHLRGLSLGELADEIGGSRDDIRDRTGRSATVFAYPFGTWDSFSAKVAGEEFKASCTTELRPLSASDPASLLPRLDAYYFQRPGRIETWGSPRFRRYVGMRSVARGVKTLARKTLASLKKSGDG